MPLSSPELRIIPLTLVLVAPAYADVFSCVQPDGRTILQSRPCKKDAKRPTTRPTTPRPEDMEFTNNKGQHCKFVPPSYVKLMCDDRTEQTHEEK
jgi:hypothetical protein